MSTADRLAHDLRPAIAVSRTQSVQGLRLHYLDYAPDGPGGDLAPRDDPRPTMLCIHGGAAHAHWFDFVAGAFTARYRVLSLDLRGHGDSEWAADADYSYLRYAADVAAFVETMAIAPVVLAGHSMGGMVSLVTAADHADRVGALVVIDSMMQMTPERATALRGIGEGQGRSFDSREAFVEGFKIRPAGSSAMPHVVGHMARHSARLGADGRWRNKFDRNVYAKRHPIDGYAYWGKVRAPVLLVAGGASDRITPEVFARIRGACPRAERLTVPGAGHHVTLDHPVGYRRGVSAFLESLPAPGRR